MTVLILLLVLSALALRRSIPVIETVFLILLVSPLLWFVVGHLVPSPLIGYALVIVALTAFILGPCARRYHAKCGLSDRATELVAAAALCCSYILFYRLCLLWPDFISIGERLRDYALLGSVTQYPLEAREPWMQGAPLNYYLYWYRFGHLISSVGLLPTWETYHELAAFAFTLYFASTFRLFQRYLHFSSLNSIVGALTVLLASNPEGVRHFFTRDTNWWGPSRVVEGAINEFPAWSFLLGDIHPHYLNLGLVPFFLLLILGTEKFKNSGLISTVLLGLLLPLWLVNANAWEVPIWGIAIGLLAGLLITEFVGRLSTFSNKKEAFFNALQGWKSSLTFDHGKSLLVIGFLALSLLWSTAHLIPGATGQGSTFASGDHQILKAVGGAVLKTPLNQMLAHWGFILLVLALRAIIFERNRVLQIVASVLLFASLFHSEALPFLGILFTWLSIQSTITIFQHGQNLTSSSRYTSLLQASFPLIFLALVIFPELFFFDDPYGGEIERMNTIFKFYSAAWYFGWVASLDSLAHCWTYLPTQAAALFRRPFALTIAKTLCCVVLMGFFYRTIGLRKTERFSVEPYAQGLSSIDQRFPGAAATIKTISNAKRGVVLEAQGNAYDYTSHFATLTSNESFLGWGNHVGLLTGNYTEVQRREAVTEQFYKEADCSKRLEIARKEGIQYIVIGPLERTKYGEQPDSALTCFRQVTAAQQYKILGLPQ